MWTKWFKSTLIFLSSTMILWLSYFMCSMYVHMCMMVIHYIRINVFSSDKVIMSLQKTWNCSIHMDFLQCLFMNFWRFKVLVKWNFNGETEICQVSLKTNFVFQSWIKVSWVWNTMSKSTMREFSFWELHIIFFLNLIDRNISCFAHCW